MIKIFYLKTLLLLFSLLAGCSNKQMRNFNAIPSFSGNFVNAVVEMPAGTNQRIKYNEHERMFLVEQVDGDDRVIDFIPCPGNFGFVPGTFLDPVLGGSGDPVEILVISESRDTGALMEVIPLLVLYFDEQSDFGEQLTNPIIIAVPANERQRVIDTVNYAGLFENYPDVVDILVKWLSSYKGPGVNELKAMGDGEVAVNEIEKWEVRRF